jgi:hypothetical protein
MNTSSGQLLALIIMSRRHTHATIYALSSINGIGPVPPRGRCLRSISNKSAQVYTCIHTEIAPKEAPTRNQQEAHWVHSRSKRPKIRIISGTS